MLKKLVRRFIPNRLVEVLWHYPKAVIAALIFGFPGKKLTVIAVAGTKGKTTTSHFIARILEEAGHTVALLSTAEVKIGKKESLNTLKMTTPSSFFLQRFLAQAVKADCTYAVLEVSSHALRQYRTFGIPFTAAVITNLMPDHLEYHKTAQDYQHTHLRLLSPSLKALVINGEDSDIDALISEGMPQRKVQHIFRFARNDQLAQQLRAANLPLLGEFNFQNTLAAATVSQALGIDFEIIKRALQNPGVTPGRMERIEAGQSFTVIVDYAHSPDSLRALYEAVKSAAFNQHPRNLRVITVFGACGERNPKVRPEMGEIIDQNSDLIVVTNDDPYGEDPEKICSELISGIKNKSLNQNFFKILDRRSAIKKALSLAQKGDLVLILGKGAEQWQVFANKKNPWDDRNVAREILA